MEKEKIIILNISEILKSSWMIIKSLRWAWIILLGTGLFKIGFNYLFKWLEEKRLKRWLEKHKKLEEWKTIDSRKFEKITAIIFKKLGYKTEVKGGAGDKGIDVIARKDGKRIFIQCKRMDKVPPTAIRDLYGSIRDDLKEGEKGILVTTGEFTKQGKEYAKTRNKPIELIDGFQLEKLANS